MNFASSRELLQDDSNWSPDDRVGLGPEPTEPDQWASWTDEPIDLWPVAQTPPARSTGPTRRGFLGLLGIVAGSLAVPALASVVGPGPIRRAYSRYQSLRLATNRIADMAGDPGVDEDWQEQALGDAVRAEEAAETEVAHRIAAAARFDIRAFCAKIVDPYRLDHTLPLARVREGSTLFMLFVTEAGGYFGADSYASSKSRDEAFTVRVIAVDLKGGEV